MDGDWLILALVALIVLLVFVYPRIQERRERELSKRLEENRDPTIAMIQVDNVMRQHRDEAGFFGPS